MSAETESFALTQQRSFNERTATCWDSYARHRIEVTSRLLACAAPHARLCVLGAGNCNDLDLAALVCAFREIVLLDWDRAALDQGVARQLGKIPPNLQLFGPCELTGFLPLLQPGAGTNIALIERFLRGELQPDLARLGAFDVVASTCVLSQLLDAATHLLGPQSARSHEIAVALRRQHIQVMCQLLVPGGRGLLVTDIVSSDTAPALLATQDPDLKPIARELLMAGNFFAGLHPGHLFLDLPAKSAAPQVSDPWLWKMGSRRFLVVAAAFRQGPSPIS
jgi:hypothetical protein